MMRLFNRTDCRNIFPLHGPLYCGILNWAFLPFFIHTVYMSIWQLHGNIPCEAPFCFYLWIDTHTHTGYRNCEKLVFLLLSKGVSSKLSSCISVGPTLKERVTVSVHINFVSIVSTCKSFPRVTLFNLSWTISSRKYSWAHRTWWAQKWFHVSFNLTFSCKHLSHNAH